MYKFLIIENDFSIIEQLRNLLEKTGFTCMFANNGQLALQAATSFEPDYILFNKEILDIDSFLLISLMKRNEKLVNTKYIVSTNDMSWQTLKQGLEIGVDEFLNQPMDFNSLLTCIQKLNNKDSHLERKPINISEKKDESYIYPTTNTEFTQMFKALFLGQPTEEYKRKQFIFRDGHRPFNLYFVKTGIVKKYKTNEFGKDYIINIYFPGDFLGLTDIFSNSVYQESAVAITDAEIIAVGKDEIDEYFSQQPNLFKGLIKLLTEEIHRNSNKLIKIAYNSLRKKVADALNELHLHTVCCLENKTELILSRDDLASLAGVAKESLIRTLKDFESESLIKLKGKEIIILKAKELELLNN